MKDTLVEVVKSLPEWGTPVLNEAQALDDEEKAIYEMLKNFNVKKLAFINSLYENWTKEEVSAAFF